jgi:hypothetical protein
VTKDKSGRARTSASSTLPRSTSATTQTDQPTPTTTNDTKQSAVPVDSLSTSAVSYRGNTTPPTTASSIFPSSPSDPSRRARFRDEEVPPVPPLPRAPTTPQRNASGSNIQQQSPMRKGSPAAASAPPVAFPGTGGGSGNLFKKNRPTQRARNRDSLDLDDIMNGDDDDHSDDELLARSNNNSPGLAVPRVGLSASTSSSSVNRSVRQIKVSQTAQDLMDFLDSGPPEPPMTSGSSDPLGNSLNSSVSSKKGGGGGRFMNMVSRLRRGSSNEKMLTRTRSFERLGSSTSRRGQSVNPNETRSLPLSVPGQIPRHRSQHNLSTGSKAPPSSWTPPLPTPPKPPAPPQPTPLQAVPLPPPTPQYQQTTSSRAGVVVDPSKRNVVSVAAAVEPSPLPSPVSIQFNRGGGSNNHNASGGGGGGNGDEVVESSLPANTLSRGSSLRSKQPLGTVPEQLGNHTSTTANGGKSPSLSRSSTTRKPVPSATEGLLEESTHPSAPVSSNLSTPVRSPLRKASRDAAVAAASAAMVAGMGETFQLMECTPDKSKTVRRPHTPTSPTVDARSRPLADDAHVTQPEDEREPVSAETAEDTLAPHSRTSASPMPSTTPSSLGDDWGERAAELRRLLAVAKHVEEARLLVDMFLIQIGLPISSSPSGDDDSIPPVPQDITKTLHAVAVEYHHPQPSCPDPLVVVETGGDDVDNYERSIVEILLGDTGTSHWDALAQETPSSAAAAAAEVKSPPVPTDAVSV